MILAYNNKKTAVVFSMDRKAINIDGRMSYLCTNASTLKKPERAISNLQSRKTGNIRHTRHREKTNKTKKNKKENKTDVQHGPHQKQGVNPGSREGQVVPVSYKTPAMLLI